MALGGRGETFLADENGHVFVIFSERAKKYIFCETSYHCRAGLNNARQQRHSSTTVVTENSPTVVFSISFQQDSVRATRAHGSGVSAGYRLAPPSGDSELLEV